MELTAANQPDKRNRGAGEGAAAPAPGRAGLRRSERLCAALKQRIRAHGPLSFADYQEQVLYDPRLGYYGVGAVLFGADGDFVTASTRSELFARCLARYYARLPELDEILEVGAGDAALCRGLLPELARLGRLPRRYRILERSPVLRRRQRELLRAALTPKCFARLSWPKAMPARPFSGLVLGLELLDALPVQRLHRRGGRWRELRVTWDDGALAWTETDPDACLAAIAGGLPEPPGGWPEGYSTECCPRLPVFLAELAAPLRRGQLLFLDYGYPRHEYYHAQRLDGTLICHYRQRAHFDPFFLPGLQDISAAVDFSALAEAGKSCGLTLEGYAEQAPWLLACGLPEMLKELQPGTSRERLESLQEAHWLLLPGAAGARFKWLSLSRNCPGPAAPWRACDRSSRLYRAPPACAGGA